MKKQLMSFAAFSFAVLCTGCVPAPGNSVDNPLDPKNEITRERAREIQENWWAQYKQSEHTETYEAHVKYNGMHQSKSGTFVADYIGVKSGKMFHFTYKEGSYNASESTSPLEAAISGGESLMIGGGFDIAEMALRNENAKFYFDGTNFTCYTKRVVHDSAYDPSYYTEETVSKMNSIGFLLYKDVKCTYTNDNIVFFQDTFYASYKLVQ